MGVTDMLNGDNELLPAAFVAVAKQTYVSPLVSPETVMGEVGLALLTILSRLLKHAAV